MSQPARGESFEAEGLQKDSAAALLTLCVHCRASLPPGARFCAACGRPVILDLKQTPQVTGATLTAPRLERKIVSILFADFAGFTLFLTKREAEDVHEWLNSIWMRVDAIISAHGGSVSKHMGDAIMALFGDRQAREDAPAQAVRAALAIQNCIEELRSRGLGMQLRIGIHTGPVIHEQTPDNKEFRTTGEAINLAQRLEQNAPPGTVLISQTTFGAVYGMFDVRSFRALNIKGIGDGVTTYLVERAKPKAVARQLRTLEGVSTEMVNRKAELAHLKNTFQSVLRDGKARMATVFGDAGIGKSRLLQEFQRWAELLPQRFWFFLGQATADMPSMPFSLLRDVFASRCEIQDNDSPEVARRKLEQGIMALVARTTDGSNWPLQEARRMAQVIGQLLGLDFSSSASVQGLLRDAEEVRRRAFHYLELFFSALARGTDHDAPEVCGVLLVTEDLHWSDTGSLSALEHLCRACGDVPLMILCLARPSLLERYAKWGQGLSAHSALRLESLSAEESRQLVNNILCKARRVPAALHQLVLREAEGNPYYTEEILRMLIDQKVIVPGTEAWKIRADRLSERVPPTLAGVLQARIAGLQPSERAVLEQAAVIGRIFWDRALEWLGSTRGGGLTAAEMAGALEGLRKRELISRRGGSAFADSTEYVFKHELLRKAVYETLLKRARREHHAKVAEWLIRQSGQRGAEFAAQVAAHLERAGRTADAAEWFGLAGEQARSGHEPAMAIDYLRKAVRLLPKARGRNQSKRLSWLEGLVESLSTQARFTEARAVAAILLAAAEQALDFTAQARAWNHVAFLHERRGDNHRSVSAALRAEKLARRGSTAGRKELIKAMHVRGWALYRLARWDSVLRLAKQSNALCRKTDDKPGLATSLKLRGVVDLQRGSYGHADRCFEQGLELFLKVGDQRNAAAMWSNLGESARLRGNFTDAVGFYEKALALTRKIGNKESEIIYLNNLSGARLGLGQYAEAETALRDLIPLATARTSSILSESFGFLAEACLAQRKIPEAVEAGHRARVLALKGGNVLELGLAWRTLGRAATQLRGSSRSLAKIEPSLRYPGRCFARSLRLFRSINAQAEQARTLRAWGQADLLLGQSRTGEKKLQEATRIFRRLKMSAELRASHSPLEH